MEETIHRVTAVCICFQVWSTGQRGGTKALATEKSESHSRSEAETAEAAGKLKRIDADNF
jgi:hypothetical protein